MSSREAPLVVARAPAGRMIGEGMPEPAGAQLHCLVYAVCATLCARGAAWVQLAGEVGDLSGGVAAERMVSGGGAGA